MKVGQFDSGIEVYISDSEYEFFHEDVYPDSMDKGSQHTFHAVVHMTIVHPEIPERAWIIIPQDAQIDIHAFYDEFLNLWESGLELASVGKTPRDKYFLPKKMADFFDTFSNMNYGARFKT